MMALIKCPECNKEISDKSEKCIHCGFPLKQNINTKCNINGVEYDLSFILTTFEQNPNDKMKIISTFMKMTNCGLADAKNIIEKIIETKIIPPVLILKQQKSTKIEEKSVPKCPTCGSTNIQKISSTKRWLSTGLFGLASSNIGKNMCCKNCGHKW